MADISKINGVPIANIEKLDAVLAANIAKVNGLVFSIAPAFTGLLDTYTGAAAGYSTRRLASSATVLMRVRRETAGGTGDDDEADVAYDSNNELSLDSAISNASAGVTATTLGQFLNVGTVNGTTYTNPDSLTVTASCFTDTWYDQSGNANHAEQTAQANQPQIHSGTVNTDLITSNGKPALQKLDRPIHMDFTTSLALSDFCVSWAGDRDSVRDEGIMLSNIALTEYLWDRSTFNFSYAWDGGSTTTGATGVGPKLYVINKNSSSINNRINGTAYTATLAGTLNVDRPISTGVNTWEGEINEIVIWNSSKASEQTDIETDINTYFSIY